MAFSLALLACLLLSSCRRADLSRQSPEQDRLVERIDGSLKVSAQYLVSRQSPDGAWRSQTYGALRHNPDLTAYVMSALFFLPQGGPDAQTAFLRGEKLLMDLLGPDGKVREDVELSYPVYTCACACRMVGIGLRDEQRLRVRRAWLDLLLKRRLGRELGWTPDDPAFGGWGFSILPPRKPAPGGFKVDFCDANLSATLFGLATLRSAKVPLNDPVYEEVLGFVRRCQNFPDDPARADPAYDDGGFFFTPTDPAQNKAGAAGHDRFGRQRFHSYGTMTADGLRALVRCGLPPEHPRVVAARKWLEQNFRADTNPGVFAADREELRNATYYYYAWAVAHALRMFGGSEIRTKHGQVNWAEALSRELLARQRTDGAWINRCTDAKEDDPLVATPWAAAALALCRVQLTGSDVTLFPRGQ